MDKVQKHNSLNTNTPSSECYRNYYYYFHCRHKTVQNHLLSLLTS